MPISRVLVTRFFQLVAERRFAEAERILERIKLRVHETEWNKGYFQALQGTILAKKSNDDQYVFLSNVNPNDENKLKHHRREFLNYARNKLYAEYDRGFFSAWADYMRILAKLMDNKRENVKMRTNQSKKRNRAKTVKSKPTQPVVEARTVPKQTVPKQTVPKQTVPKQTVQTKLG